MDRVAVFVDAGYVFAAGSTLITGEKLTRGALQLDHSAVIKELAAFATALSGLPLLRVYWYDGTSTGPTPQHLALAYHDNVKVRLGIVNRYGEQKGVDSLIVTDLIEIARNRAMADAVVVSGDEDIRVGVQQAQEFGVRVHLLGIEPTKTNQSSLLVQEADSVHEWHAADISKFLQLANRRLVAPQLSDLPQGCEPLEGVARFVASALSPEDLDVIMASAAEHQLPREFDRVLLVGASRAVGAELNADQKRRIRELFMIACQERAKQSG